MVRWSSLLEYQVLDNGLCGSGDMPNYHPNSYGGPQPNPAYKEHRESVTGDVYRHDSSDEDNFSQCTIFYTKVRTLSMNSLYTCTRVATIFPLNKTGFHIIFCSQRRIRVSLCKLQPRAFGHKYSVYTGVRCVLLPIHQWTRLVGASSLYTNLFSMYDNL